MSDEAVLIQNNEIKYHFVNEEAYTDFFGIGDSQKYIQSSTGQFYYIMYAGNGDQVLSISSDTDINVNDKIVWEQENNIFPAYASADFNGSGDINVNDKIIWELNNNTFSSVPR